MNSKPIMQRYWTGTEWQERQRCQRRLHLVPAPAKPKPSLRQRVRDWYGANYEDVFEGCGPAIYFVVGMSATAVIAVAFFRVMGWW